MEESQTLTRLVWFDITSCHLMQKSVFSINDLSTLRKFGEDYVCSISPSFLPLQKLQMLLLMIRAFTFQYYRDFRPPLFLLMENTDFTILWRDNIYHYRRDIEYLNEHPVPFGRIYSLYQNNANKSQDFWCTW